jgi:hypothetical protein
VSTQRLPDVIEAYKIAKLLGVTVEYLLTGADPQGIPIEIFKIVEKMIELDKNDLEDIITLIDTKHARYADKTRDVG